MDSKVPLPNQLLVPNIIHLQNRTKLAGMMKKELQQRVEGAIILLKGV
jgi:hypothetical protein